MSSVALASTSAADAQALHGLLQAMARGDRAALAELFERCADRVYAVALRLLRQAEDADEIVSDVFLQAWREADRFDATRGSVEAWLLRITHSRAIDRLRQRKARPDLAAGVHPEDLPATYTQVEDVAVALLEAFAAGSAIQRALATLSAEQRRLIGLAFFEDLSHAEIAERTGQPLGTVKSTLRRGLQALRKQLEESGYEHA